VIFKVDDFYFIRKGVCLLLVINSNLGRISHRFRDMTSFPLRKVYIFLYASPFNPEFENVTLELHPPNFVRREHRQKADYFCKQFSL